MNAHQDWSDQRLLDLLDALCLRAIVPRKVQARDDIEDVWSDGLRRLWPGKGPSVEQTLAVWEKYLWQRFDSALTDLHRRQLFAKKRDLSKEVARDVLASGSSTIRLVDFRNDNGCDFFSTVSTVYAVLDSIAQIRGGSWGGLRADSL